MNIKLFKKLIKEAVAEAIYEELPEILEEALKKQQKQSLREGDDRTLSFNSDDVMAIPKGTRLPADVRSSLATRIGESFGMNPQPVTSKLEIIDKVDDSTGQPVNPYLAFIADAAANMTAQDRAGLKNLDM